MNFGVLAIMAISKIPGYSHKTEGIRTALYIKLSRLLYLQVKRS